MKQIIKITIMLSVILITVYSCGNDDNSSEVINNAPEIENQTFSTKNNIDETTVIGTVIATDLDNDALTFSITTNDNDLFEVNAAGDLTLAKDKVFLSMLKPSKLL